MVAQLNLFDSLPPEVLQRLSESADQLAGMIEDSSGHTSGVHPNVVGLLPSLYEIFAKHYAVVDPSAGLVRSVAIFAESLSTFAAGAQRDALFNKVAPTEEVVRYAFNVFCTGSVSFFGETTGGSAIPATSYIQQLKKTDSESDAGSAAGVRIVESGSPPRYSSSAELMGSLRAAVFAFRRAASVAMRGVEVQAHARRMYALSQEFVQRGMAPDQEMVDAYFNKGTMLSYRIMMGSFERWLLVDLAHAIDEAISLGSEAMQKNQPRMIIRVADMLNDHFEAGRQTVQQLEQAGALYSKLLDECGTRGMGVASDERWASLRWQIEGFCHDYVNLLSELILIARKLRNDPTMRGGQARSVIEMDLPSFRMSDTSSQLNIVKWLLRNKADRKGVEIEIAASEPFIVPKAYRLSLFRIIHELGLNALKHGGARVRLEAVVAEKMLRAIISDNGPGFVDLEKALAGGGQEHPEVEGQGKGLKGVVALAKLRGWDFHILRESGTTIATLEADTSGWEAENGTDGGTGDTVPIDDALMLGDLEGESILPELFLPPMPTGTVR